MKGRTVCPQCNTEFVVDVPENTEKHTITCEHCGTEFSIRCNKTECVPGDWEEHGEPRKTVLSALKPKTKKPIVASFLLLTVAVLGIFNGVLEVYNQLTYLPFIYEVITNLQFGILILVCGCCALAGFVASFKRRFYTVAAVSAFISIFSMGFLIGLALGVAAFVLIVLSRDEFENATKGKVF